MVDNLAIKTPVSAVEYSAPIPSELNKQSVFSLAEEIAKILRYSPETGFDKIVNDLGGAIKYKDYWELGNSDSGSLLVRSEDDFEIYVATDTTEERDRFTIAHELGHYYLHYLLPKWQDASLSLAGLRADRFGSGRVEWEANWFAAAFLMPEKKFRQSLKKNNRSISRTAKEFGVSRSAAKIRAESLSLDFVD